MFHAGGVIDSLGWWLAFGLSSLAFCFPVGGGRKEHRS